eukprot:Pgem_evm1s18715
MYRTLVKDYCEGKNVNSEKKLWKLEKIQKPFPHLQLKKEDPPLTLQSIIRAYTPLSIRSKLEQ